MASRPSKEKMLQEVSGTTQPQAGLSSGSSYYYYYYYYYHHLSATCSARRAVGWPVSSRSHSSSYLRAPLRSAPFFWQVEANPASLEELLQMVSVPDTETVKAAEEVLKAYNKKPNSVPALLTQLRGSPNHSSRQLSSVLLRKGIPRHWDKFNAVQKSEIKSALLDSVVKEPIRIVRHAIATLIARLAKILLEDPSDQAQAQVAEGWPELLQLIAQLAQAPSEDHRELAFLILLELTDTTGDVLKAHFDSLRLLFLAALDDPSPRVQVMVLQSSGALLCYLSMEQEGMKFADLIPKTLNVAAQCVARGDEDAVVHINENFAELCSSPLPLVKPYLPQMVDFLLEVLRKDDLELSTRDSASLALSSLAECKGKQLAKTGRVPAILEVMAHLIASHEGSAANALFTYEALHDEGEDDEYDGPSSQSIAQTALDMLAIHLPVKHVYGPVMEICGRCFGHPNAQMRKAGVAMMGVVTEGCAEPIRNSLATILPEILRAAVDPEPLVRECACFCLGQFSEHCQPDILEYHAEILPVVFRLLDDATDNVKGVSCYVLEMFCENLEPESVGPFIAPLMQRLVLMLQTPKRAVQEMSVAAIAATAIAAEKSFLPYLEGVATMMMQMLTITAEPMLMLRGRALECMGHIAIAVEKESFAPYVKPCMISATQALKIDSLDLHEYSYTFFANLSKVMGESFGEFVPELVPHLLGEVRATDGDDASKAFPDDAVADEELEMSDEDEFGDHMYMNVRTAMMDKKKAALLALGALADNVPRMFEPHLVNAVQTLQPNLDYWHPDIRAEVCDCLSSMVRVSAACYPPAQHWEAGRPLPLPPHTEQLSHTVVQMLLTMMKEDEETSVAARACESLTVILDLVGPMSMTPVVNDIMQMTALLLGKKARCQECASDGSDEEDDAESDNSLSDAVGEMLAAFARTMGPSFLPFFDQFYPMLAKYAKSSRPAQERAMAMGTFAEVMEALGPVGTKYFAGLLPLVKRCMAEEDSRVRRNTAFCAGVMAESAGEGAIPHFMELLQALAPAFAPDRSSGQAEQGVQDNAASAVARIIMIKPDAVPLDQVLPALISVLPLKVDMNENKPVYRCVLGLITMGHPAATQQLPAILEVLGRALRENRVQDEIKVQIAQGLAQVAQSPQFSSALAQVSAESQTSLGHAISTGSSLPPPQ
jgi:hypothetical protein